MTKGQTRQALGAVLCALALLPCASCVDDKYALEEEMTEAGESAPITMSLTIQTRAIQSDVKDYEKGSIYENYVDVSGGDYRIYFFTSDNKYITRFVPDAFVETDKDGYTTYSVGGEVPEELLDYSDFKMVVLANWGNTYPDEDTSFSFTEETTIDDICEASWSQYDALTDFELGPSNLIPFYGVHEYTGINFKQAKVTTLSDPLTLLRAVAKVEVVLEPDDNELLSFEYVTLHRYNEKGYSAPNGVYSKEDYDHDYTWDLDFVNHLHLVNGHNDGNGTPEKKELTFLQTQERSVEDNIKETWVAYAPEYRNTDIANPDDYSYIEIKLKGYSRTHKIYFANYDEDTGTTTAYRYGEEIEDGEYSDRYDIRRNYLYRFVVSVGNDIRVFVRKWDNTYENVFEFIDSSTEN